MEVGIRRIKYKEERMVILLALKGERYYDIMYFMTKGALHSVSHLKIKHTKLACMCLSVYCKYFFGAVCFG